MKSIFILLLTSVGLLFAAAVESPFGAKARFTETAEALLVRVELTGPAGGHLNAGLLRLKAPDGYTAVVVRRPEPEEDELFDEGVYLPGTILEFRVSPAVPCPALTLEIQGCVEDMCYLPQEIALEDLLGDVVASSSEPNFSDETFRVVFGYQPVPQFIAWLDNALETEATSSANGLVTLQLARHYGLWLGALVLIFLGILLNFTPCVLPMIPVTLAVLGTKSAGAGRRKGFLLGASYGGAMAAAYGLVGAIFVRIGGRFGGINANPWFQASVGIVLICLALSMFDLFFLDLTRFRSAKVVTGGSYLTSAFLGGMTALLAGACVAPVLVWALVWSVELYSGGNAFGLFLPTFLGIGLGLPWPFLGAGLGFLPKPGVWMTRVKQFFGVLILLFALYYLGNAYDLWRSSRRGPEAKGKIALDGGVEAIAWHTDYATAVAEARRLHRPLFIDFWGVTCKACDTMDATTLHAPEVRQRLAQMTCLKLQADDFSASDIAPLISRFHIPGLPAYVLLFP